MDNLSPNRFKKKLFVTSQALDENQHVNNVQYVQWMQDIAIEHSNQVGGDVIIQRLNTTWVARQHIIDYLASAHLGDEILIETWIDSLKKVSCERHYVFSRKSDDKLLARGKTTWVYLDISTSKPRAIPEELIDQFCQN